MDTLDSIHQRWGCRKYLDEPLDKGTIGEILDAGRMAPSAGNLQDRSFIVVKDSEIKAQIAEAAGNQMWMQNAPVIIVVLAENSKLGKFFGTRGEKTYSVQDTSFAAENMLLAATDLGLGSSLIVGFDEYRLKTILNIGPPAEPYAIITVGKPLEKPKPSSKYPLEKFVYFNKYGARAADAESAFAAIQKTAEKMTSNTMEFGKDIKKKGPGIMEKIKSMFRKKHKIEDQMMAMEFPPPEKFSSRKDDIPRQLPK